MRASVLDLGSNSFHVLVADVEPDGTVTPVFREREMLHLGRAVAAGDGRVPDADRQRAVEVVAHLTELAQRTGATTHHAVATAALREADNGAAVLAEMARAADTPIRRISGVEEARLAYLGVRAARGATGRGLAVLDLGGGSLELALGSTREPDVVHSTPLGISRLSTLVRADPARSQDRDRLRAAVDDALEDLLPGLRDALPHDVVAVGGTVRAMARVVAAADHAWTPATLNRLHLSTERLAALRDRLWALDIDDRAAVDGMKSRRADHLHVAAEVLVRVLEQLGVEGLEVCDWGLREGVLLDAVGSADAPTPPDLRTREVARLAGAFPADHDHRAHVTHLACVLFDRTAALHGLGPAQRELLVHAATLHDVGEALALRRHNHHGAYILEHAELRGFSPGQLAVLVTLVRFHSSRGISRSYPPYVAMADERQRSCEVLLGLLQVAEGLDRTRDGAVRDVQVDASNDDRLVLRLHGTGLAPARTELARRTKVLRKALGREVEVLGPGVPVQP